MNKKSIYSLVVLLIGVGYIVYEKYGNQESTDKELEPTVTIQENNNHERTPKELTNTYYLPTSTTDQVVHHEGYSFSYSEPHEQAEWVAYELKKSQVVYTDFKRPYFYVDKAVKTKSADWRNYKKSEYDRGHLCPAGDRRYSKAAFEETFLTSNITPQRHDFNSGIWNRLEQKVRYWAKKYDGVYVVTGGILEDGLKGIGEEHVDVPNYFYKILLDNSDGKTKMIAFLMPHKDSDRPLYEFVVSVDEIEKRTGIDFFSMLDDAKENRLEASASYKEWSFR